MYICSAGLACHLLVNTTVEPGLAVTFTLQSARGSPDIAANTNNTLDSLVYSGHLSSKVKQFFVHG